MLDLPADVLTIRHADPMLDQSNSAPSQPQASEIGVEHSEVLAELDRQQTRKKGWGSAIVILAVSMILFVAAGAAQWSLGFVALLIPILLLHELGHYIAMRVFKYQNLRMFFIPFFGAAVTGQHYGVAGWKKAIVSLMGPLPGIMLAVALGTIGIITHQSALIKVAVATLILNGFNLLPVLPLDGGWVMHALLFSRHYMLDVAFRALAAVALLIGSVALSDRILMFIGIPLLLSLPIAFKLARIANDLRERGLPPALPDMQKIPVQTAQAIIAEVKKAFPKGSTNKSIAQHTLQIFETLNARPPGWAATAGLLVLYGGSGVTALIFVVLFAIAQHGDLGGFVSAAARQPKQEVTCGAIETWRGAESRNDPQQHRITVIATHPRASAVNTAFGRLAGKLPSDGAITRFGSSLLVSLPANDDDVRKQWLDELGRETKDVFVASSNFHATLSITCIAPTAERAKVIEAAANEYLGMPYAVHLIPPWSPEDQRTSQEREQHNRARQIYARAQSLRAEQYKASELTALNKRITQAQRRGDTAEAAKFQADYQRLLKDLDRRTLTELRATAQTKTEQDVIALYADQAASTNYRPLKASSPIGKYLGQLPLQGDEPVAGVDRYSTRWGSVTRNSLLLSFHYLSFNDISEGAPAFAKWLCSNGCMDVKYEFVSGFGAASDDL